MKVLVAVHATLRADTPEAARAVHDGQVMTAENMAQFKAAGNISHQAYLDPARPGALMALDGWEVDKLEDALSFYQSPEFAGAAGIMVEGEPEIAFWQPSGWTSWG